GELYLPAKGWAGDNKAINLIGYRDLRQMREAARSVETVNYRQAHKPVTEADVNDAIRLADDLKFDEGKRKFDRLIADRDHDPEATILNASILIRQGRLQQAADSLKTMKGSVHDYRLLDHHLTQLQGRGATPQAKEAGRWLRKFISLRER